MIDLYSWPTPNGHKVHIMLEELKLDYNVYAINIGSGEQFDDEFLKISPNNRIPAIVDHDGVGSGPVSLFESGAILIYLAEKSRKLLPTRPKDRYIALQWLMWQMGGVGPMFGQSNHFSHYAPRKIKYAIDRYNNECHRLYGVLDKRLGEGDYLAGKTYSIADIATFPWANNYQRREIKISQFPNVANWLNLLNKRSAVKRGLKVLADRRSGKKSFTKKERDILFGSAQYKRR